MPRPPARHPTVPAAAAEPSTAALPDPPSFQVLNEVGIIGQLSQNLASRLLAPALNLSQYSLLNHFARLRGERSLVQLAAAMQVSKGAMTNTVGRLADKGLLAVQPDPEDGRGKRVSLTAAGLAARQQAVQQLAQGMAGLAEAVADEELTAALPALRKLRSWLDSHR